MGEVKADQRNFSKRVRGTCRNSVSLAYVIAVGKMEVSFTDKFLESTADFMDIISEGCDSNLPF